MFPCFFVFLGEQLSFAATWVSILAATWVCISLGGNMAACDVSVQVHSCCTDILSSLYAGDNTVPVTGSGRTCQSRPIRSGAREGHVGASNALN